LKQAAYNSELIQQDFECIVAKYGVTPEELRGYGEITSRNL